jgi:DNA modification methylase
MGWVKGNQPPDYGEGNGERTQTTVWEVASVSNADRKDFNHSTPKPSALFAIPIVKHLQHGETAYEPFAGSGPQFLAAEQLGRRCYGMEIEPKYVAVIIHRMQQLGCTAELV